MITERTIEQLAAELRATKRKKELTQTRAELVQERKRADLLNMVLTDANELHAEVRAELTQAHEELAQAQATGTRTCADLTIAQVRLGKARDYSEGLEQRVENLNQLLDGQSVKLAQARAELKDLHETDHKFGRQTIRRNRDYWYDKAVDAEAERDKMRKEAQVQSDEVQRDWLSPVEAEGLRRQLARMEGMRNSWRREYKRNDKRLATAAEEAAIIEAAKTLVEKTGKVHVGSVLREELAVARDEMNNTLKHRSDAAAKLLERLATLDAAEAALADARWVAGVWYHRAIDRKKKLGQARDELADAEAALADCGLTGIYGDFGDPADAIEQMVKRLVQLEGGQGLQNERQLRREAERRAENFHSTLLNVHKALDKYQAEASTESAQARISGLGQYLEEAEQHAEVLGQECDEWRMDWQSVTADLLNTQGHLAEAEQRAETLRLMIAGISEALDGCGVEHYHHLDRDSEGMSTQARVLSLCVELDRLEHVVRRESQLRREVETRAKNAEQRAERAEALAALVNEETAALLERLAGVVAGQSYHTTADRACTLAAQIREALDDNKT